MAPTRRQGSNNVGALQGYTLRGFGLRGHHGCAGSGAAVEHAIYVSVGATSRPPIGWVEFCTEHPKDCATGPSAPRDVVLTRKAWKDLIRVNKWVNDTIKPITDLDQWGVVEKWSYPDTGKGDCEDYVLLKRRMLMQAGWPREALLITVVRDKKGDGHAVLTVKTDKGDSSSITRRRTSCSGRRPDTALSNASRRATERLGRAGRSATGHRHRDGTLS